MAKRRRPAAQIADGPAAQTMDGPMVERRRPGYVSLAFAGLGLVASAYLTVDHFSSSAVLACPENATINCAKVIASKWSHIVGIPVALLGLIYFAVLVVLCLPVAWRVAALDRWRIAAVGVSAISVIYLVYIELFQVDAICLWCTAVHVCTIALLASVLLHDPSAPERRQES